MVDDLVVTWEPSPDNPDNDVVAIINGRWRLVASVDGDWLVDDQHDVAFVGNPGTTGFTLEQAKEKAVIVLRALLAIPGGI